MTQPPAVLTPSEVSEILRINERTVRRMVNAGHLDRLPGIRHVP